MWSMLISQHKWNAIDFSVIIGQLVDDFYNVHFRFLCLFLQTIDSKQNHSNTLVSTWTGNTIVFGLKKAQPFFHIRLIAPKPN